MPLRVPAVVTGLEASIEAQAKRAGKNLKLNLGTSAKSIEGLSQPLGRITGKADQFTKSMEAANARVLAFGASVGVLSAVTQGFKELVNTTIQVEKQLASINTILGATTGQLDAFKKTIFEVARNTEQSFDTVATAALELSRQGLKTEQVIERLNDSLILSRLSGLGASEAVSGLTAAINSFRKQGVTSTEVLNKLSAASIKAAVSERDLIEGIKRSGSVAQVAGVSLDELVGMISAVQEKTARGGAVIGNSFKTIFTRIQSLDKLRTMQQLGVEIEDASGQVLSATQLIQNLANTIERLPDATRLQIAENLVGKFQIAPFLAILDDYNSKTSKAIEITGVAASATNEAYQRNIGLNQTLSAVINEANVNLKELAETLGSIGITDSLRNVLGFFNNLVTNIKDLLEGEGIGSTFAKGIVKGIGGVLSGPGLAIFGAIIAKLTIDLVRFGMGSLKTFFGLNKAAQQQKTLQGQIASTLLGNKGIQQQILAIENSTLSTEQKRASQIKFFTTALNEQLRVMTQMQGIAGRIAPSVLRGTATARRGGKAAGGYIPNFDAVSGYGSERQDIARGVGGAPPSARPVTIPNFNFGGGERGPIVANSSEFIIPNFAGKSGSAIFNQNMAASMGLPAGAKKIGAAGGFIPNFAAKKGKKGVIDASRYFMLVPKMKTAPFGLGERTIKGVKVGGGVGYGLKKGKVKTVSDKEEDAFRKRMRASIFRHTARFTHKFKPLGRSASSAEIRQGFDSEKGAKGALQAVMGSAFEVGIIKALDYQAAIREKGGDFDVRLGVGLERVRELFGLPASKNTGDFKISDSSGNIISFYKKVIKESRAGDIDLRKEKKPMALKLATQMVRRDPRFSAMFGSKGQPLAKHRETINTEVQRRLPAATASFTRGASGYIPNFAASPLQDAIERESAAGLPISQIRVNQDSRLRGATNPMGLAVTNMRDEPTGAIPFAGGFIPNYSWNAGVTKAQVTGAGHQWNKAGVQSFKAGGGGGPPSSGPGVQRDLLGPIFAVTAAMSALQGATAGAESNLAKFTNITAKALSGMTTAAFAGSALNQFGKDIGGAGGTFVSKLGLYGAAVGAGVALFKGINEVILEATGKNKEATLSMAALSDATKNLTFRFDTLSEVRKAEIKEQAKEAVKGTVTMTVDEYAVGAGPGGGAAFKTGKQIQQTFQRSFVGGKDKESGKTLEQQFEEAAAHMIALGMTTQEVDDKLDTFGNQLNADDLATLSDFITSLDKGLSQDAKDFRAALKNLTDKQFEALQKGLKGDVSGATIIPLSLQAGEALTAARAQAGLPDAGKLLPSERKGELVTEESKKRAELQKGVAGDSARLELEAQKKILAATLEIRKARLTNTNQIKGQINAAKILGNLTGEELRVLERKEFIENQANKRIEGRIDLIKEQVEAAKVLSISEEQRDLLAEKFGALDKKKIKDAEQLRTLLGEVIGIDKARSNAAETLLDSLFELLTAEENLLDVQDLINLAWKDGDIATRNIADNLKEATDQMIRAASARAFDVTQGNVRQNIADRQDIARLQTELVGAGPEDVERISKRLNDLQAGITRRGGEDLRATGLLEAQTIAGRIAQLDTTLVPGAREFGDTRTKGQELQDDILAKKTQEEVVAFVRELAKTGTDKQKEEIEKALPGLEQALRRQADATDEVANNAEKLATALTPFDREKLQSGLKLRQARKMGVGVAAAERLDRATRESQGQGLFAQEARDLSTLQRGVFQRLKESPDFQEVYQTDALHESLKNAALTFKNTMSDAMVDAIIQGGSLGDILRSAATDFFTMLSKAYMQNAVDRIVGEGGGLLARVGSALFGGNTRNSGGIITGGSGSRDDVPTLLTGGEFVIRRSSVQKYGEGFLEDLNTGRVGQMQSGGKFPRRGSSLGERGNFYTPGTYGQGSITGTQNLLDFATQSHTSGQFDRVSGGAGYGSASLEPMSARLTMFGRRNSPLFQREQESQREAFGLYTRQIQYEEQVRQQNEEDRRQFRNSMLAAAASAALSYGIDYLAENLPQTPKPLGEDISPRRLSERPAGPAAATLTTTPTSRSRRTSVNIAPGVAAAPPPVPLPLDTFESDMVDLDIRDEDLRAILHSHPTDGSPFRNNRAAGGYISPTAGVDTVPSMLSGGEFVMNAATTQRMGRGNLAALNAGGGGEGGDAAIVAAINNLGDELGGSGETIINITVNSDGTETQDGDGDDQQQNLALKIKDVVRQTIQEEKRLGGSLRRQ